jgi:hypothetical protein
LGLLPPPIEFGGRGAAAPARWKHVLKHHDALGIGIGEGLQQNRIDHRENRGVGGDAQRQGRDCGKSEPRRLAKHARGMLQVL